ncbi:AsnC family protein [Microbacterium schleiferi]|nr:AsnC family protein [Microbacterium schleiferi]
MEKELDPIDERIVALLSADGRMTNAALADAIGLAPRPSTPAFAP